MLNLRKHWAGWNSAHVAPYHHRWGETLDPAVRPCAKQDGDDEASTTRDRQPEASTKLLKRPLASARLFLMRDRGAGFVAVNLGSSSMASVEEKVASVVCVGEEKVKR